MKKLTLLFPVLFAAFVINAQNVAINNDGSSATASAMLDVKSTTKGFMMPRVTSAQRTAISSPVLGLLVFDTDTKTIWAFNGIAWSNLSSAGGGGFTLPYENSAAVAGSAFKLTNSGNAIEGITSGVSSSGIRGTATANGSNGVMGFGAASNGVGVRGESNTGTGMIAYSTSGTGLSASSISGTGINASSISGLALNVNGNLKIAGGNTNPGEGKILTSDASGNAVWKANRIAFRGFDINENYLTIPSLSIQKIYYAYQNYDLGNNFTPYELSGPSPANAATFVAPLDGIYHFDASVDLRYAEGDVDAYAEIRLLLDRNGVISELASETGKKARPYALHANDYTFYNLKVAGDFLLFPGDKVYVEVDQSNIDQLTA
ncbi:MAG TPA: hypothetical protein VIU35_12630, partial [Chitinophagaceae bacterium]